MRTSSYASNTKRSTYVHSLIVVESSGVKILWDVMIQCDHYIENRKPDIVVVEKDDRRCFIVDVAIPGDKRIVSREEEKVEKYQELRQDMIRMWKLKKAEVVPIVVGALGVVTPNIERWLKKLKLKV